MAKKKVFSPFVFLLDIEDDPTVIGGGTGQSTTDPFPCTFETWLSLFAADENGDTLMNEADYEIWFKRLFGDDEWNKWNNQPAPADPVDPTSILDPEAVDPVAEMLDPGV